MLETMTLASPYNINMLNLDAFNKPLGSDGRLSIPFNDYGVAGEGSKSLVTTNTPYGNDKVYKIVTASADGVSRDYVGGWDVLKMSVDPSKTYRLSVWVRMSGTKDPNNRVYLGCNRSSLPKDTVLNAITNAEDTNPYFAIFNDDLGVDTKWVLIVGYIHAHSLRVTSPKGRLYLEDGTSFLSPGEHRDYKFKSSCTLFHHRAYSFYGTKKGSVVEFYHPRIDLCDGNEVPTEQLLERKYP